MRADQGVYIKCTKDDFIVYLKDYYVPHLK